MATLMFSGYESQKKRAGAQSARSRRDKTSGRTTFQRQITRRDMSDNQITALTLKSELDAYIDIPVDRRRNLRNEMIELESLSRMNMRYLAGALFIMEMQTRSRSPDYSFDPRNPVIMSVLERLGVRTGDDAPPPIKALEVLMTYIFVVTNFRRKGDVISTEYNPDEIYEEAEDVVEDEDDAPIRRIEDVGRLHLADYDDDD